MQPFHVCRQLIGSRHFYCASLSLRCIICTCIHVRLTLTHTFRALLNPPTPLTIVLLLRPSNSSTTAGFPLSVRMVFCLSPPTHPTGTQNRHLDWIHYTPDQETYIPRIQIYIYFNSFTCAVRVRVSSPPYLYLSLLPSPDDWLRPTRSEQLTLTFTTGRRRHDPASCRGRTQPSIHTHYCGEKRGCAETEETSAHQRDKTIFGRGKDGKDPILGTRNIATCLCVACFLWSTCTSRTWAAQANKKTVSPRDKPPSAGNKNDTSEQTETIHAPNAYNTPWLLALPLNLCDWKDTRQHPPANLCSLYDMLYTWRWRTKFWRCRALNQLLCISRRFVGLKT